MRPAHRRVTLQRLQVCNASVQMTQTGAVLCCSHGRILGTWRYGITEGRLELPHAQCDNRHGFADIEDVPKKKVKLSKPLQRAAKEPDSDDFTISKLSSEELKQARCSCLCFCLKQKGKRASMG